MTTRRALVASYYVPEDDRDSGSRRLLDFIRFLREADWQVDFVAANGLGDSRYLRNLLQRGVAVHDASPTRNETGAHARSKIVDRLLETGSFDLALLAFWPIAELYLPNLRRLSPRTRVIVDSLDLHFLRDARRTFHRMVAGENRPLLDAEFAEQMRGELNTYAAADAVLTVSKTEAELLDQFLGDCVGIEVMPDCEDMAVSPLPVSERRGILLLGSYRHPPNVEAVEYLCREVLPFVNPKLLEKHRVDIVGDGLSNETRRLIEGTPNMRIVGWVPSVIPYFHQARISVIPLLYGAGTKRKMIQALMTGTPTVTTSIGAEGLGLIDDVHVSIADQPKAFAAAIERLLQDDEVCERFAATGRSHIQLTHGRETVREKFHRFLKLTLTRPAKPPMLPECTIEQQWQRVNYQYYQQIVASIQKVVEKHLPATAGLVIAGEGSEELLRIGGRHVQHFPRRADGSYRREPLPDFNAVVEHLEELQANGSEYLILPSKIASQFETRYADFSTELEKRFPLAVRDDACTIYHLLSSVTVHHRLPAETINRTRLDKSSDAEPVPVRLIAFHLPQYHPIPENDAWWGEGFTEWRNVAKAKPLFTGHHQPQLPADLGFYDLRLTEAREAQANLARAYGIHGFCYYHYWFHGKRLLQRPVNDLLQTGKPDFPFCLCWANESWSRRWDGSENEVLQSQSYSHEDDLNHIRELLPALADPRAIQIDGKPVFIVYQPKQLPDTARTTDTWRQEVERAGLKGIYLIAVETGWDAGWDATEVGFDAKVLFQPQFSMLGTIPRLDVINPRPRVYDYRQVWPVLANPEPVSYLRYDTVFPSWDNSPRRGEESWIVHQSTPEEYEKWLRHAIERAVERPVDQRIVFVNAWNEWAEGCHLEPDRKDGLGYLEATRRALSRKKVRTR